mmetsp:Transcript_81924/g.228332  ORF Transcript_81924/g.228332 Transcript_81924/m.228332 type:complete len:264 (-) Transcript_81924:307-1098(-)
MRLGWWLRVLDLGISGCGLFTACGRLLLLRCSFSAASYPVLNGHNLLMQPRGLRSLAIGSQRFRQTVRRGQRVHMLSSKGPLHRVRDLSVEVDGFGVFARGLERTCQTDRSSDRILVFCPKHPSLCSPRVLLPQGIRQATCRTQGVWVLRTENATFCRERLPLQHNSTGLPNLHVETMRPTLRGEVLAPTQCVRVVRTKDPLQLMLALRTEHIGQRGAIVISVTIHALHPVPESHCEAPASLTHVGMSRSWIAAHQTEKLAPP